MPQERMIVVANSRKSGGRCLAGVTTAAHRLVRPVSGIGQAGALSDGECNVGGRTPGLLEVVTFGHCGARGTPEQPENVLIDRTPWRSEGSADPAGALDTLMALAEDGPKLFGNRGRAVAADDAAQGTASSLALVAPATVQFGHGPAAEGHKGSPRAVFELGGHHWSLPITDFEIAPTILSLPEGLHDWEALGLARPEQVVLTVSLGVEYDGWHHKLVAGIIRFG